MKNSAPQPPSAKSVDFEFEHLGKTYIDPYRWLQDKEDEEVIDYLRAENAYAKAVLNHTEELQETIFYEMRGRMKEDDSTVPEKYGDFFYYWRTETGKQYRILCRKQGSVDAPEQILLDENVLAEGKEYTRIFYADPSPDNRLLAYGVDDTGSLVFNIYIMDMQTGETLSGPIPNGAWSIAWASDNQTLFYTVFDDSHRAYRLMRHTLGTDHNDDVVVFQEDDETFSVDIESDRSETFLIMTLESHTTTEVYYLRADNPSGEFSLIHPRQAWVEYYATPTNSEWLILTNEEAQNFKLMRAPLDSPQKHNWKEAIPHREDVLLEGVDAFKDYIVITERAGGLHRLAYSAPDSLTSPVYVPMPEPVYSLGLSGNPEYDTHIIRFHYNSLVTPNIVVDYDLTTGEWMERKRQEIPSGYNPAEYSSERVFATAEDGSQIPISLIYKKGFERNGQAPLLLYGYGSYGISMEASFRTSRFSLIDRGFVYAIAHIRGGSEMGRAWYENGRLMQKKNSFTDFIACAEHLIAEQYTSQEKLAIRGGSAGGLLVSAVMNLRPDLCQAVVAEVPFTNVITAMLDPDLPLTVTEYEQWGNPNDEEAFAYMLSYSPYENVQAVDYPHVFVRTGINDLQVPYWDPAKWVANMRAIKTGDSKILLITEMGAGHGGASGRYDSLKEEAEVYAFLLDAMAMADT